MRKTIFYQTSCIEDLYPVFDNIFKTNFKGRTELEGTVLKISGGTSFKFNCNNIFGSIHCSIKDNKQYINFELASFQLAGARFDAMAEFIMKDVCSLKKASYNKISYIPYGTIPTVQYLDKKTENNDIKLDVLEQLKRLKELLDLGAITQDEFEKMKSKIIG